MSPLCFCNPLNPQYKDACPNGKLAFQAGGEKLAVETPAPGAGTTTTAAATTNSQYAMIGGGTIGALLFIGLVVFLIWKLSSKKPLNRPHIVYGRKPLA